jgi:hypothetical protein
MAGFRSESEDSTRRVYTPSGYQPLNSQFEYGCIAIFALGIVLCTGIETDAGFTEYGHLQSGLTGNYALEIPNHQI